MARVCALEGMAVLGEEMVGCGGFEGSCRAVGGQVLLGGKRGWRHVTSTSTLAERAAVRDGQVRKRAVHAG